MHGHARCVERGESGAQLAQNYSSEDLDDSIYTCKWALGWRISDYVLHWTRSGKGDLDEHGANNGSPDHSCSGWSHTRGGARVQCALSSKLVEIETLTHNLRS
jgi:hypothetical protein